MYLDLVLRPEMAKIPADARAPLQAGMGTGRARQITVISSTGTVLLGMLRGIAGGVLDQLDTAYGLTYLAALVLGLLMAGSIWTRGYGGRYTGWLWMGSFLVMFSLMIAMRFGY
jgi:hypothetical protein